MQPKIFSAEVTKVMEELDGNFRFVASGRFGNGNYQAQVMRRSRYPKGIEYVLFVASTDPQNLDFSYQQFPAGAVEFLENADALLFEDTSLPPPFEGLGSIAVPFPS